MELLYLWINCSDHDCIIQQEFNFSPLYKFKVDNLINPRDLFCEKKDTINLFNSSMDNGKINNITAIVGSNGAGKTTLLSFIAKNNCFSKFDSRPGYEKHDENNYEHHKSIYAFIEDGELIVYYNLEGELTCNFAKYENIYWNKANNIEQLDTVRNQLIIYISNSSYVPEAFLVYSESDKTCNINLHQKSVYLVANSFYKALLGKAGLENISENDDGFAWVIKENRDDRKFQELLDLQYYQYLSENRISDYVGNFKYEINIYFENIIDLIKRKYLNKTPSELGKKYSDKIKDFENHYNLNEIKEARRKNCTVVLYVNLLFEMFFYEKRFQLPTMDFNKNFYEQLKKLPQSKKYKVYLKDIKIIDDILNPCPMNVNIIGNPDDDGCLYEKVICKENTNFYKHIHEIFKERKSFTLRYIRVKNLEMSSGERAMQNMFSWLVLLPELDEIMGMKRSNYTSKLILIDEIDLYAHPEWQRKTMDQLISTINKIETVKPVQIVVSSHSPLILSDFPRQNVIYMNKRDEKTIVDDNDNHKQSFGANIYTLLKEAFFLENGAVGEFAKKKIYEVYKEIKSTDNYIDSRQNLHQHIINLIGDEFARNEMQKSFDKKYGKVPQPTIMEIPQNIDELKKLKKQLENSLDAVNKMLGGGQYD